MARVLQENNSVYVNGWPCNILHDADKKGTSTFELETGFDIEDM